MRTFAIETTVARVQVFHQNKVVFEREVDFFGETEPLRQAREEANLLVSFLYDHPNAETVPLANGWTWRNLR